MEEKMNCKICEKELFSGLGRGCKMCGMPLEEKLNNFCCEKCEKEYGSRNKFKKKKKK